MRKRRSPVSAVSNCKCRSAARAVPCPCASRVHPEDQGARFLRQRHHPGDNPLPAVCRPRLSAGNGAKLCILGSAASLHRHRRAASADWQGGRRRGRSVEFARRANVAIIGAIWTFVRWRSAKGLSRDHLRRYCMSRRALLRHPRVPFAEGRHVKKEVENLRKLGVIDRIPLMGGSHTIDGLTEEEGFDAVRRHAACRILPSSPVKTSTPTSANDLLTLQPR